MVLFWAMPALRDKYMFKISNYLNRIIEHSFKIILIIINKVDSNTKIIKEVIAQNSIHILIKDMFR